MTTNRRSLLAGAAGLALTAGTARAQQESVTIGWTGPLSGGAALYGKNTLTGLEMAAKEINDAGGLDVGGKKVKINVVALDDKYSPSEAAVNAKRLRAQYKAPVVFCPHSGGNFAMQAFNEQDGFVVAAYTSVPQMTERGNKLTLRIPPSFAGYVTPFIKVTMERFGKKLGMGGADHDYAKAWAALIAPAWKTAGGTVVAENPMSYNKDTDFYSGVSRITAASPDVMFVGGASEPTALVVRQARELGFQGGFIVMDQAKLDEMAAVLGGYQMLEGSIGTLPIVFDSRPGPKDFVARFRKIYSKDPGSESSLNYSALNAVADAMRLAGTTADAAAIHAKLSDAFKGLPQSRNPSVIGGVDPRGGSNAQLLVATVKDGKIVPIDAATGALQN
ncbi:ABC transporter substrate-binding protein [Enterovirga sp.]|jgi:branched-chain amino acid transport system substrate-binding protein|uniref:ABC transporter substrate-binding protein n=1 Tax=Enterovirga sp. TaxID=2026350 RepID=UPI002616A2D8|nr:ABC transporter substrate-binding protein [Enterovirga sp.]MDB5591887.1 livK [Enterovirga sp.]